jgi:hypothetical protein
MTETNQRVEPPSLASSRWSPWWTPWGAAIRLARVVRRPSDLAVMARIGWFVLRLPDDVQRSHLGEFLNRLASAPRPAARAPGEGAERIVRLRQPWLRVPGLRSRDTCYIRALTLYRFLDAPGHVVRLHVGAEWHDKPGGVLHGHAWVTLDGQILEGPPEADAHDRLQLISLTKEPRNQEGRAVSESR